jgi:hypothetical protein
MTHKEIIVKLSDISSDLFFLTKDDFFQGEASQMDIVLKNYLENVSFMLDKFSDAISEESGEEDD